MKNILEQIKKVLSHHMDVDVNKIDQQTSFINDLDIHPLDLLQLVVEIEKVFKIELSDEEVQQIETIKDLVQSIQEAIEHPPKNIFEQVKDVTIEQLAVEAKEVHPNTLFIKDLGADSLDLAELIITLEKELEINLPNEKMDQIQSVQDVVDCVEELSKQTTIQQLKKIFRTHSRKIHPRSIFADDLHQYNPELAKVIAPIDKQWHTDLSSQFNQFQTLVNLVKYIENNSSKK